MTEYVQRHQAVWPDMLTALDDSGWRNHSTFLRNDGPLVGYIEADDHHAAQAAMAAVDVNARWRAEMAEFFTGIDGRAPDESFLLLDEVFHLEDRLLQHPRRRWRLIEETRS